MAIKQHYQVAYRRHGRCSYLIIMYIEELIQFATGSGLWLFKHNNFVSGHDATILSSFADQIAYNANQLTEKQGHLALRILNKHRDVLRPAVKNLDSHLDNPKWKNPFRVLTKNKRISIKAYDAQGVTPYGKMRICIEFPYENDLVEIMRKRNGEVHDVFKGIWDGDLKQWVFPLSERNIEWLGNTLLTREFQADEQFLEYFKSISDALIDLENHIPMLVSVDGKFQLKNCHKNIPQPDTEDLVQALFCAREYGITTWDDTIESQLATMHPVTKTILSISSKKHPWVDSGMYNINSFTDLITHGGPALVIIPGGSELEMVKNWSEFGRSLGFRTEDMSVMFRLPNDQSDFNQYVKAENLNGPVTDNTKMVFVSTKITKPLIKSGVKFNTVINLGYYNYMHFTMSTIVDNARNLVYYSTKAPTIQKRWQPHELS